MKRKYNKAITTLTIIVMLVTMLLPIGVNAAPYVTDPGAVAGTFTETDDNDGRVEGTVNVQLSANYDSYNTSEAQSQLPSGLKLNITGSGKNAQVKITTINKVANHNINDSMSFKVKFKLKNSTNQEKTFNIVFRENPQSEHNYAEQAANLTRGKIRVLEVYPSVLTNDAANNKSDPSVPVKDLYEALKSNSKFEVTTMSLNKFISLRDEVNGNYDVIYFGRGTYSRNTVTDLDYGNDITELRANQVLEYINANQLCIFHSSAFSKKDTVMYNMFNPIRGRDNVKEINSVSNSTAGYIETEYAKQNINRRPILSVTKKPVSYRSAGQPLQSHNLTFEYGVKDPDLKEDADLAVELYIDWNGNSLFEPSERVATRKVKNGDFDTITHNLNTDLTGIYFWKLVVTDSTTMDDEGSEYLGAKAEYTDVFRVKGDPMYIRVLQIKPDVSTQSLAALFDQPVPGRPGETFGNRWGEFDIDVTEVTVNEFNTGTKNKDPKYLLNGNYDMVVLGFKDAYGDSKLEQSAVNELQSFIDTHQSVMFTHDTVHFDRNVNLSENFYDDVGQQVPTSKGITAGLLGYKDNGGNGNYRSQYGQAYYNNVNTEYKIANYQKVGVNDTATLVSPVNSNTLTLYPYNLETVQQGERKVATTHHQWLKLNLEDEQIVPLFNLYEQAAGERVNEDAMNNYYTYTKGNITYSGTGHSDGYPEYEIQLFVNTAIKAHSVANKKPVIEWINPVGNKINKTTTLIGLEFKLQDDYDTELLYWVDVDLNNDGVFEKKIAEGLKANTNVKIDQHKIQNRSSVGTFKVRIRAKETSKTGAESVLIKELECVSTPVISPTVSFTNMLDQPITACLIGEQIKINTTVKAEGNLSLAENVEPTYDLTAKYLNGSTVLDVNDEPVGTFRFHPTNVPDPIEIIKKNELTVTPDTSVRLDVTPKVNYNINGSLITQDGFGSIQVNEGLVNITVLDTDGRKIKDVQVKDHGIDLPVKTNIAGKISQNKITGTHKYTIDLPGGYTLTPDSVKAKNMITGVEVETNSAADVTLSGENYYWEVTFTLTLDMGVHAKYYKMKSDASGNWSAAFLGDDGSNYYLRCKQGAPARYLARIQIDDIDAVNVKGVKFEIETYKKDVGGVPGSKIDPVPANAGKFATVVSSGVTLTGAVPAELTSLNINKQLKAVDNGLADVPADGTYAGKSYYLVLEIVNADLQKVKITKVTLTMESGPPEDFALNSAIIFGEPATPLLR